VIAENLELEDVITQNHKMEEKTVPEKTRKLPIAVMTTAF